jgi:hypothetical protein
MVIVGDGKLWLSLSPGKRSPRLKLLAPFAMVVPLSNDVGFVLSLDRLGYSCGVLFCWKGFPIEEQAGRPLNVVVSRRFHGSVSYWGPTCVSDQHHQSKCYGQLTLNRHYAHLTGVLSDNAPDYANPRRTTPAQTRVILDSGFPVNKIKQLSSCSRAWTMNAPLVMLALISAHGSPAVGLVHCLHSIDEDIEPVWLRLEQFCRTLA